MRKWVICLLFFACLTSIWCFVDSEPVSGDSAGLVTSSFATYRDNAGYAGNRISSHFDAYEDFVVLNVLDNGGCHVDGEGKEVYSNYVNININFVYDSKTLKMPKTEDVYLSEDTAKAINTSYRGESGEKDLRAAIGKGVIIITRTNGRGEVFEYEALHTNGNNLSEYLFNEDGDYKISIFFETCKQRVYQNHVVTYEFSIRSRIYLLNSEGTGHVKDSGIYYDAIMVDYAYRDGLNVRYELNGVSYEAADQEILEQEGVYRFTVESDYFLCEEFDFILDTESIQERVFFQNLNKELGEGYYQAEGWFSWTWQDKLINDITCTYTYNTYSFDQGKAYTKGTKLTEAGVYYIRIRSNTQELLYIVELNDYNDPSYNYEKLYAPRFNNFVSKWYEVYNDLTGRYYCFAMSEYDTAYDAAMTIENTRLVDASGGFYYYETKYTDRVELTAAMHEKAVANIKVKYYDFEEEKVEKTFSPLLFDYTAYLNDEFQFLSMHKSEVSSVTLSKDGVTLNIPFNKPIGELNIPDGEYRVREIDCYGNESTYTVFRDLSAPIVEISLNGQDKMVAVAGTEYTGNYFSIASMTDAYDEYCVIRVNDEYFYEEEFRDINFGEPGVYNIAAYDRNDNSISFSIRINEKNFEIVGANNFSQTEGEVKIYFDDRETISDISINSVTYEGELQYDSQAQQYYLECSPQDKDQEIVVNLKNGEADDKIQVKVLGRGTAEEGMSGTIDPDNSDRFLLEVIIISSAAFLVLLGGIIISIVSRRRESK